MADYNKLFGEYILNLRVEKNLSQTAVAKMAGIAQPYLSLLESGQRDVNFTVAIKLCDTLGVDLKDFIKSIE